MKLWPAPDAPLWPHREAPAAPLVAARPIRPQAAAAFTLARDLAWEGVDNLAVARRLLFMRRRFAADFTARGHVR